MSAPPPESSTGHGQQPAVERGGLWALLFASVGLVLPVYGILLSLIGVLQGRRARRTAIANEATAPGAVLSIVLGWLGIALWGAVIAGGAVLQEELQSWNSCQARANTIAVQHDCDAQLRTDLEARGVPEIVIDNIIR